LNRREFLRIAGLAVACMGVQPGLELLSAMPVASSRGGGRKWAMVIDLAACSKKDGCTDCIAACHRIHNVPLIDSKKEEIKWIWTAPFQEAFGAQAHGYMSEERRLKPVLVLCNHCENPACVSVCPTRATFRRDDGLVMMDYHRCIGCRYCMAACPYGARSFNWRDPRPHIKEIDAGFPTRARGVVEKCSFCDERLAKGLMPACVEACREKGLFFGDLNDRNSEVRKIIEARYVLRRKPELGTEPKVFYLV
jgi:molybdopterin-containing oxidoreductase family iron-sulfur binding subunit